MQAERDRLAWAMLTLILGTSAAAEEPAKSAASTATDSPSLELLEFLGEWETDDGAWVDPFSLLLESDTGTQK